MAGNFYTVRCPDCENEQALFGKAATTVACAVCGTTLAHSTGGKTAIDGEVTDTIERRDAEDPFAGEAAVR